MTWAFSDESERAATMLFGVLLIEPSAVAASRAALVGLLLPGQRRVHTAKESARRRRDLLDVVAGLETQAIVLTLRREMGVSRRSARARLLAEASLIIAERAVVRWVLDHQEPAQAHRDRQAIDVAMRRAGRDVVYDHQPSHGEPLLWAIDATLWAVGSGGDWRRRAGSNLEIRQLRP